MYIKGGFLKMERFLILLKIKYKNLRVLFKINNFINKLKMIRFISTFTRKLQKLSNNCKVGSNVCINRNFCKENKTFLDDEIERFNAVNDWWDVNGSMSGLHGYNKLRIDFIRKNLAKNDKISPKFKF